MRKLTPLLRSFCGLVLPLAGCDAVGEVRLQTDVDAQLTHGAAYVEHLTAAAPSQLSDGEVIALGYLERVRLGLGSPFRTAEYALRDPLLLPETRRSLAYAILSLVQRGAAYQVDPAVLQLVRLSGTSAVATGGLHQLRLIEQSIDWAPSADAGERMVRLGYQLAGAERTLADERRQVLVAHVAALLADRRRAREDVVALLRAADQQGGDPLALLPGWRSELRFRVERAVPPALSISEEVAVARGGPRVALALRTLAQRLSAPSTLVPVGSPPADSRSHLKPEVAQRLLDLARTRDYPAQAPVAAAVLVNRADDEPGQELMGEAWNEERLVALARLQRDAGANARLPLMELQSAAFLRGWSQEEVWYPGDPAPTARDLTARFGLASVEFGRGMPEHWRSYYLRMLGVSLAELQRVFPTASVRGLTIRIDQLPVTRRALALHDPRTRTLYLPPHTGAGTLAHEVAHDLDWQLARTRYGIRGSYGTDLAVRRSRGDRISFALAELTTSLAQQDTTASEHDLRPAEVFARGADWFVATSLARSGRRGGYLSSYQDASLTGYGTTRSPDIAGAAVPALLNLLETIAPAADRSRGWLLEVYGPNRTLSPGELARGVLAAGRGQGVEGRLLAVAAARERSLAASSPAACRLGSAEGLRQLVGAKRALVQVSTVSAARGAVIDAGRALAQQWLGPGSRPLVDAWMAWRMFGAPEPADTALRPLEPALQDLLVRLEGIGTGPELPLTTAFHAHPSVSLCGGNPFASPSIQSQVRPSQPAYPPAVRTSGQGSNQ